MEEYQALASRVTYDRNGEVVRVSLNQYEQVCMFARDYPETVTTLVLQKEDQWFYYHPGVHPYRMLEALVARGMGLASGGASTVTQQLAKTLLGNTTERSVTHKAEEAILALVLEYFHSKDDILTMYLNTVSLGGNIQGFPAGARAYFNKTTSELNTNEVLQLVSALSNPNSARPLSETNLGRAEVLAHVLGTDSPIVSPEDTTSDVSDMWLELTSLERGCRDCTTTLDADLTERVRDILRRHITRGKEYGIRHGAVVVVDVHSGELLAMVGSPNPNSLEDGMRINMALETRPIGSTIKPFLYLLGFEKGLRPYTTVVDREYKFDIETGFPLYPKNYDGLYRGTVTLEESLANSLNVPTVEVVRFATLPDTYDFLRHTMSFVPPQSWGSYAYGIALGGLELDLLTLTHAFTALADKGVLKPLVVERTTDGTLHTFTPPHSALVKTRSIADPALVALVNAILSDRTAGVEQFGQKGSLHLSRDGYAVKTGTSRDYHDSWTVGYTGDYAVGVWLGNVENKPMDEVSGAMGAGAVWHDVMELMFTTPYYHGTPIDQSAVVRIQDARGYSFGLTGDDIEHARGLLQDTTLLLFPYDGDVFLFRDGMRIPLSTAEDAQWNIVPMSGEVRNGAWYPTAPGTYTLTATAGGRMERVTVRITEDQATAP